MRFTFLSVAISCGLFFVGCGANEKTPDTGDSAKETSSIEKATEKAPDNEIKAVDELCSCFNSFMANMSPRVKRILVDAGKSSHPEQVLPAELQKIKGVEEQERLVMEFEQFQNSDQLQQCSANIQQKYNLNEADTASRERILKIAGANKECEVVYALMKIGLSQQAMQR
jgi:hypothetical protein